MSLRGLRATLGILRLTPGRRQTPTISSITEIAASVVRPQVKVSILLPVYNGERFLAQAIESALAQTLADFELLICDDASTDSSPAIIERFAAADSRIKMWRNDSNKGLFANYNECLSRANGEFIKPFAQDDLLEPTMLAETCAALERDASIKLVSTARNWVSDSGAVVNVVAPFPSDRIITGREVILYNLLQLTNWVGEPSTVLFRAEQIGDKFDTALYHYGDIDYWFRIVEHGNYCYLNKVLCSFRRHDGSATSKNLAGMYFALDILRMGKKYRQYSEQLGESEHHFLKRALEVMAINVDHLVRKEGLDATRALAASGGKGNGGQAETEAFKELSFYALRYITELLAEHDDLKCRTADQRQHLERQLADMRQSTSWKLTAPLRQISRGRGV